MKNEHTWDMRYAGSKVIDEAKLDCDRHELAGKVYEKMEEARRSDVGDHWWASHEGVTRLRDMRKNSLKKRMISLIEDLYEPTAERDEASTISWLIKFVAELERRREEAAAKSRIDDVAVAVYNPINYDSWSAKAYIKH